MNAKPICKCEVILNDKSCVNARVGICPLVRRESDNCGVYDSYYDYDAHIFMMVKKETMMMKCISQQPGNDPDG